jgi:hypothetical protein
VHPSLVRGRLEFANSLAESRIEAALRGAQGLTYADPHIRNLLLALLHLAVVTAKLNLLLNPSAPAARRPQNITDAALTPL